MADPTSFSAQDLVFGFLVLAFIIGMVIPNVIQRDAPTDDEGETD